MANVIDYPCPSCGAGPRKRCRDGMGRVKVSCFDRVQAQSDDFREEVRSAISESQFQREVMQLLRAAGWKVYHANKPKRDERGFPDIVAAKDGTVIFAELKTETGRLRAEQKEWRDEIRGAYFVWRPSDMEDIKKTIGVW